MTRPTCDCCYKLLLKSNSLHTCPVSQTSCPGSGNKPRHLYHKHPIQAAETSLGTLIDLQLQVFIQSNIRSQEQTFVEGAEPLLYYLRRLSSCPQVINYLCSENPEVTLTHKNQPLLTDSTVSSYQFTFCLTLRAIPNSFSSQHLLQILSFQFHPQPLHFQQKAFTYQKHRWHPTENVSSSLPATSNVHLSQECSFPLSHHYSCKR